MKRTRVFISYSHHDRRWLDLLRTHLRPLERSGQIDLWDDSRLVPGAPWREEIREAIASTKVAVLLVSANFLASDFIAHQELPPLLKAAQDDGAQVIPVIISGCLFEYLPALNRFQAFNAPSLPLDVMARGRREQVLARLASTIHGCVALPIPPLSEIPDVRPSSEIRRWPQESDVTGESLSVIPMSSPPDAPAPSIEPPAHAPDSSDAPQAWALIGANANGRGGYWLGAIGVALALVVAILLAPSMFRGKPAGPAPGSYWYAETADLRQTFGSLNWCQFELTLSKTHVSMRFDQDIALENADLGFVYNERVTGKKNEPGYTCGSGILPNTEKKFALAHYTHANRTVHVEFRETSSLPPGSFATLDGTFDEGGTRFDGVLRIVRRDQQRTDRPALHIFDWMVEQAVQLTPP